MNVEEIINFNKNNYFASKVTARYVRIHPVEWPTESSYGIGLRAAVYVANTDNNTDNIYHKSSLCFGPNSILAATDPQPIEFLANDYASSLSEAPTNWETLSQIGVANYFNINRNQKKQNKNEQTQKP